MTLHSTYLHVFMAMLLCLFACNQTEQKKEETKSMHQTDTTTTGKYAAVNGLNMYYEIHGSGKPLVLIHGGGSTIESTFSKVLPELAKKYKVIAVELQAHGHSGDRDQPLSFQQDADDVVDLLKQLKIPNAYFLGFSNGGQTAMQAAISHPGIVSKLIIASAFYKRDGAIPGFFDGLQQATIKDMPAPLKTAFLKIDPDSTHMQNMFNKDRQRMLDFKDWSDDDLRSIKVPVLIIAGNHDVALPEHTVKMSELIPNATLMILPGEHGTYLGEVFAAKKDSRLPEVTVTVIEEFLDAPGK